MLKAIAMRLFLVVGMLLLSGPAMAAEPAMKLERVVMLMRHGIRPPTKLQPIPDEYNPAPWPQWPVGPGLLTPHGAKGVALLAEADRATLAAAGLIAASVCPAAGQLTVKASKVSRAIDTARAWSNGFAPGCGIIVVHPAGGEPDSLFHPLERKPGWFDGKGAWKAALAQPPGLERQARELAPLMRELEVILDCAEPACDLESPASTLVEQPHDRPKLNGPLGVASTASETLLLEFLETRGVETVAH